MGMDFLQTAVAVGVNEPLMFSTDEVTELRRWW